MSDKTTGFEIWNLDGDLNTTDFTPVSPNAEWNNLYIQNDSAESLIVRTTNDNERTQKTIPAGEGLAIAVPRSSAGSRFKPSRPAFFAKVGAGDGTGVCCIWA